MDVDGYADPYLASLYEGGCAWYPSDEFYVGLVLAAGDVLDVGCGTGAVLAEAVRRGHPGRLVGLDPAEGMLAQARTRPGVEWVRGVLEPGRWGAEFDLVIMTGHAFQELRTDDAIRTFLATAHDALRPGGRLAFETRNPLRRAWERWHGNSEQVVDPAGVTVTVTHEVVDVTGELVTFTETYRSDTRDEPLVSRSTLRFLPADRLEVLLTAAGFTIDDRFGDWDRAPFTTDSDEIITVASATT